MTSCDPWRHRLCVPQLSLTRSAKLPAIVLATYFLVVLFTAALMLLRPEVTMNLWRWVSDNCHKARAYNVLWASRHTSACVMINAAAYIRCFSGWHGLGMRGPAINPLTNDALTRLNRPVHAGIPINTFVTETMTLTKCNCLRIFTLWCEKLLRCKVLNGCQNVMTSCSSQNGYTKFLSGRRRITKN